jgi:hypothetical protein
MVIWSPELNADSQIMRTGFLEKKKQKFINFARQNEDCYDILSQKKRKENLCRPSSKGGRIGFYRKAWNMGLRMYVLGMALGQMVALCLIIS